MFNFIFEGKIGEILAPVIPINQLFLAIQHHRNNELQNLIHSNQFDLTSKSETGYSAIHVACRYNNIIALDLILQKGVPIDYPDNQNNTTLHYASKYGHFELCKLLIERGCSPAKKNSNNKTPYDVSESHVIRQYLLPLQLRYESGDSSMMGSNVFISTNQQYSQNFISPEHFSTSQSNIPSPSNFNTVPINTSTYPPAPLYPNAANQSMVYSSHVPNSNPVNINQDQTPSVRKIKADGFHSSASDPELQAKYGHVKAAINIAPPPTSNFQGRQDNNMYSLGSTYNSNSNVYNRYVPYDAHNNAPVPPPVYMAPPNQGNSSVAASYGLPPTSVQATYPIAPSPIPARTQSNVTSSNLQGYVNVYQPNAQVFVNNVPGDEIVSADSSSSSVL